MAFAIFYNRYDLTEIAAETQAANLNNTFTAAERKYTRDIWNNGLSSWSNWPVAPLEYQGGDADTRIGVISFGTLQQFVDFLYNVGTRVPDAEYMVAISLDVAQPPGSMEPWPVV